MRLQYHPAACRQATTVVVRKPKRAEHSNASDWRPIALLVCIGKLLESVMKDRLKTVIIKLGVIPDTQMGFDGRSTTTALLHLLEIIENAWTKGKIVSLLSLDMSGAYDKVDGRHLVQMLHDKRVPSWIVKFIKSFLTARRSQIKIPGFKSDWMNVETGIPQGSGLSPLLFIIFTSGLLESLNGLNKAKITFDTTATCGLAYIDDTYCIAISDSVQENCRLLEDQHAKCLSWASAHGMTFNAAKYDIIHFTRNQPHKAAAKRALARSIPRIEGFTALPRDSIVFLGVTLDRRLNWNAHIQKVRSLLAPCERVARLIQSPVLWQVGPPLRRFPEADACNFGTSIIASETSLQRNCSAGYFIRVWRMVSLEGLATSVISYADQTPDAAK